MQYTGQGLELTSGVLIEVSSSRAWIVRARSEIFPLENTKDFYRVWLLLECPFGDVENALSRLATEHSAQTKFPLREVVASAFLSKSRQWTERAMEWVPFFSIEERAFLRDDLTDVASSDWASQRVRQLATKYVNELRRTE